MNGIVQAKERMVKMVRRIIEERKKKLMENNHESAVNDVVDVLLQDKDSSSKLSLEMISENIIEFMIPGEETLPTAMTLALKFLTDSPLALSKLQVPSQNIHSFISNQMVVV